MPDSFVPSEIISDALRETRAADKNPPLLIDPIQGHLLDFGYLRDYTAVRRRKCVAYASGINTNILNVAGIIDEEFKLDSHANASLELPIIGQYRASLDLQEPILGVKFAGSEHTDSIRALLSVRTRSGIWFFRPGIARAELSRQQMMTIDLISKIDAPAFSSFSDIAFNPWYWRQLAVVDTFGNIQLSEMNSRNVGEQTQNLKMIDNDLNEEPGSHRLLWGTNLNSLIVVNSKTIQEFDLRQGTGGFPVKYAPRKSSKILDVCNVPEKSNEIVVLTTDDLIWFDLRYFPKEALAWKHYRDHDLGLKCSTFTKNDGKLTLAKVADNGIIKQSLDTFALLYSTSEPLVTCYQFGMRDNLPFSCEDPYIFSLGRGPRALSIIPVPFELSPRSDLENEISECSFLTTFQLSMDYSLVQRVYCTDNISSLKSVALEIWVDSESSANETESTLPRDQTPVIKPKMVEFSFLYQMIFQEDDKTLITSSSDETTRDVCERIWQSVTASTNSNFRTPMTFSEIAKYSGVNDDLASFTTGLREVAEALINQGYRVYNIGLENLPYIGLNGLDAQGIYEKFLTLWVRSLPTSAKIVYHEDSSGNIVREEAIRPVAAKVRLRRERISRKIAGDLAMQSAVVSQVKEQFDGDKSNVESALQALSQVVRFKQRVQAGSNSQRLASEW